MDNATKRKGWLAAFRHVSLLIALCVLGAGVYWFMCEPDRNWPSRAMHYKDLMITDSPNLASEQRRITVSDAASIIGGSSALAVIGIGVVRVIQSWKRSLV